MLTLRIARVLFVCAALLGGTLNAAAAERSPLWVLKGKHNSVYLLGSVHVLRESDYPLPASIGAAYDDAEVLYMELDLDDLDASEALQFTMTRGALPEDRTLRDVLGLPDFTTADTKAAALGVDLGMFARFEPWVAAMAVVQAQISRLGLSPQNGVEHYVLRQATRDGKEILGLETLGDQLGVLDGLSLERQSKFLLMSLEDASSMADQLDEMIRAWKQGDSAVLARALSEEFADFPELYDALIVARNRNWTEQIAALLDHKQDYLIVVGALHLVGEHSVLEMLSERGVVAVQR